MDINIILKEIEPTIDKGTLKFIREVLSTLDNVFNKMNWNDVVCTRIYNYYYKLGEKVYEFPIYKPYWECSIFEIQPVIEKYISFDLKYVENKFKEMGFKVETLQDRIMFNITKEQFNKLFENKVLKKTIN